jgi:lipid-A-disaccharide synthase
LATVGFKDVIRKYSFFKKVIRDCSDFIRTNDPDAVILIDYPGLNIRLAEEIRKFYTKKIIYYISPQLWAWHEKRVFKIKKYVDKMLVVFPFEVDFYRKFGVDAVYTGHPLVKKIRAFMKENPKTNRAFGSEKIITVLPGSRKDEVRLHMPVLIKTLNQLSREFDIKVNISTAPGLEMVFGKYRTELKKYNFASENVHRLVLNSDLVLAKAGTSTMECALLGIPHLIFYRTSPFNYYLLKPIVKVKNLGIVNLLAGKNIVKEFVQNDFTPDKLLFEAREILVNAHYRNNMINQLSSVWDILGPSDASHNAAKAIIETAGI